MKFWIGSVCLVICLASTLSAQQQFPHIHSHNDYTREVPFWEAVLGGAKSIEADLILKDGELYVAHEEASILPERTFANMYLNPILQAKKMQYRIGRDYFLTLDIKTAAVPTLEKLLEQLNGFPSLLYDTESNPEGLKFVISGNRPKPEAYASYPGFILFDHQSIEDLAQVPLHKVAMFSFPYYRFGNWRGEQEIPTELQEKLSTIVAKIHDLDKPIRFWATADNPATWDFLIELGVDFINTDQPMKLRRYLDGKVSALQSD